MVENERKKDRRHNYGSIKTDNGKWLFKISATEEIYVMCDENRAATKDRRAKP